MDIFFLEFEVVKGEGLHYWLGSIRETTSYSAVVLLLFIEFAHFEVIEIFRHLWVHYSCSYFLVFPIYFKLPHRPSSEIRRTWFLAWCWGNTMPAWASLYGLMLLFYLWWRYFFFDMALNTCESSQKLMIFFLQFAYLQIPYIMRILIFFFG